ncbi:Glutathione S-transferase 1, isoform C [Halotydeus destructor]|nr:Glutathione S-transferase 1, isoform C [Halotydeus destructor]
MTVDFYYKPACNPCRAVLMTARALNVDMNLKEINLENGDQFKSDFVAINPQHCVPTLHDTEKGLVLWESRAICSYLVNKYSPGHALYPECPMKRAKVDQMLNFDIGSLYKALAEGVVAKLIPGKVVEEGKEQAFKDKLALLEGYLSGNKYVAGDTLTIADLSIVAGIGFLKVVNYDLTAYPNIVAWRARLEQGLPFYKEVNDEPLVAFKAEMDAKKVAV